MLVTEVGIAMRVDALYPGERRRHTTTCSSPAARCPQHDQVVWYCDDAGFLQQPGTPHTGPPIDALNFCQYAFAHVALQLPNKAAGVLLWNQVM